MSILVTGGCGYIGSVTVDVLHASGHEVAVIDNLARGHRKALSSDVPFYEGDVGDTELVARVVADHAIDYCIHFAALAYVGESVECPQLYYENNLGKGVALLQALLDGGVGRLVFSSSCSVYGAPEHVPLSESNPSQPISPYGWSKLLLEEVIERFAMNYGLDYSILRYFNAAGATAARGEDRDSETRLIPLALQAAEGHRPHVTVFGDDFDTPDGTAIRDYVHVEDLADAHVAAVSSLSEGCGSTLVNIGSGRGHSVRQVIDAAERVTGMAIPVEIGPSRDGDPAHLVADITLAQSLLEWNPRHTDLEEIIDSAWQWRLRNLGGYRR